MSNIVTYCKSFYIVFFIHSCYTPFHGGVTMEYDKNYAFIIHEIKNNVAILQSALQLMKKNHPNIHDYEEWDIIHSACSGLSDIFSHLTPIKNNEKITLNIQPMNDFLFIFETHVKQLCLNAEISTPIFDFCKKDSIMLSIHTSLLERAILNLVQNGIDAMKNSNSKQLIIRTYLKDNQFCISITDHGIGMTNETQKLMYTPSFTTKRDGFGLGLCIVKEIINAHHGTLLCESVLNQGTTFHVLLPIIE